MPSVNNNAVLVLNPNETYEVTIYAPLDSYDDEVGREIMQFDVTGIAALWKWQHITAGTRYTMTYRRVE